MDSSSENIDEGNYMSLLTSTSHPWLVRQCQTLFDLTTVVITNGSCYNNSNVIAICMMLRFSNNKTTIDNSTCYVLLLGGSLSVISSLILL